MVRWLISDGFVRQSKRALSQQAAHGEEANM